jgi:hypothetical protein
MQDVPQDTIHPLDIAYTVFVSMDDYRYTALDLSQVGREVDSESRVQSTVNYSTLMIPQISQSVS